MVAIQIMLGIYAAVIAVAVCGALIAPRMQRWLIRRGARDPQWLYIGDEPPGFKQFRDELKRQ